MARCRATMQPSWRRDLDMLEDRIRCAVRVFKLSGLPVDRDVVRRATGTELHRDRQHVDTLIDRLARDPFPWR